MNHKVQTTKKNFDDINKQALHYMHIYVYTCVSINVLLSKKYIIVKCKWGARATSSFGEVNVEQYFYTDVLCTLTYMWGIGNKTLWVGFYFFFFWNLIKKKSRVTSFFACFLGLTASIKLIDMWYTTHCPAPSFIQLVIFLWDPK